MAIRAIWIKNQLVPLQLDHRLLTEFENSFLRLVIKTQGHRFGVVPSQFIAEYISIRDELLHRWSIESKLIAVKKQRIEDEENRNDVREGNEVTLSERLAYTLAAMFLHRYRYINYGIIERPLNIVNGKRIRIVIVGAGMAGLTAAREILNLYAFRAEPEPEVIILEGRSRVGGRMHSFRLSSTAQPNDIISPVVDLGKHVVFRKGN